MSSRSLLHLVTRPGRYVGREFNATDPSGTETVHCALVFPDLYEIGMSHQGLQILYHIINGVDGGGAERCYCPAPDAEALMRAHGVPLASLETGRPLARFDLIGVTLPHELCYTNILTILDLASIPLLARDRRETDPIVLGGGTGSFNPEPVAAFFDAILVGDGEEAIVEVIEAIRTSRRKRPGRAAVIEGLAGIAGIYVPAMYRPRYDGDGSLQDVAAPPGRPDRVKRRVLANLDRVDHLSAPLVPNARIIHERVSVEVARGCTRGCRFCQAGMIYRPVRERTADQVIALAEEGVARTGFDEVGLLSLSTGDYSCLPEVLPRLMRRFAADRVSVAMPSMRVGTLTEDMMREIRKVRKTGFTLAPEAGSERLRRTINKNITEADLLEAAEHAFALGWNLIKLYFMIGLPTETDEDLEAIVDLVAKTAAVGNTGRGRRRISVSVGTFVPKPHTPFQWEPQLSIEESRRRLRFLKDRLHGRGVALRYHDPEQSYLEGVFSRGDRRLAGLIIGAWRKGARLDSWSEHFDLRHWREAAEESGLDLDSYLRGRTPGSPLPWQHIDSGVDDRYLIDELHKSRDLVATPDCRSASCQQCGLCDFETVMPVVHDHDRPATAAAGIDTPAPEPAPADSCRYLVTYARTGDICYLGHLEMTQVILRSIRRAGLKPHYSQGFNPSPKVSFSNALPVGTASSCERFTMDLTRRIDDIGAAITRLNRSLPDGLAVVSIEPHRGKLSHDLVSSYRITLETPLDPEQRELIRRRAGRTRLLVPRQRKGRTAEVDFRPLIGRVAIPDGCAVELDVISRSGAPGAKPIEILAALLDTAPENLLGARVAKTASRPLLN